MTRKRKQHVPQLNPASGGPVPQSAPVWITGTFTNTANWPLGTIGWDLVQDPDPCPTTAYGVLERIDFEEPDPNRIDRRIFYREPRVRPVGILMHALTWHVVSQLRDERVDVKAKTIVGIPVTTTWDMPEWAWVFAHAPKRRTPMIRDDMELAKALNEPARTFLRIDSKSSKIKARGRR